MEEDNKEIKKEKKIFRVEDLPEKDNIYFKKDIFGWYIIHPIRDEDGKLNWTNLIFGGKRNAWFTLILCLLILGICFSYSHDINKINEHYEYISANPLTFCKNVANGNYSATKNNFTIIEEALRG